MSADTAYWPRPDGDRTPIGSIFLRVRLQQPHLVERLVSRVGQVVDVDDQRTGAALCVDGHETRRSRGRGDGMEGGGGHRRWRRMSCLAAHEAEDRTGDDEQQHGGDHGRTPQPPAGDPGDGVRPTLSSLPTPVLSSGRTSGGRGIVTPTEESSGLAGSGSGSGGPSSVGRRIREDRDRARRAVARSEDGGRRGPPRGRPAHGRRGRILPGDGRRRSPPCSASPVRRPTRSGVSSCAVVPSGHDHPPSSISIREALHAPGHPGLYRAEGNPETIGDLRLGQA